MNVYGDTNGEKTFICIIANAGEERSIRELDQGGRILVEEKKSIKGPLGIRQEAQRCSQTTKSFHD